MKIISFTLLIKFTFLIILSWILIHIMAVLGVFFSFAYPAWRFLSPKAIACPICWAKKSRECSFNHALSTVAVLLIFSAVSMGLVFGESKAFLALGFSSPKTVSFIIPTKGQYRLGEVFPMKIDIAGVKGPVNSIQADLSFDPNKLEAVNVSTKESFASIFIQKEINNEAGFVRLTGGLPNPGFFADHGVFGTVYFKGKNPGVVKIEFLPTSLVLENNGQGTNVLKDLAAVSYLILPEKISDEEKAQQDLASKQLVLGENIESSSSPKMEFYDNDSVLGIKTAQEIQQVQQKKIPDSFGEFPWGLDKIDQLILKPWQKLLSLGFN